LSPKIKLCGIKDKESMIAGGSADYIGFVFYQKSPRFISALEAKKLKSFLKPNQKLVGLFVNADLNLLNYINDYLSLDLIQLHGDEDLKYIERVRELKKPIIKAIPVKNSLDIIRAEEYKNHCDMILFDTKINSQVSGGSGISFDWNLLRGYYSSKKWILAGGLNEANIVKALKITNAPIIDVSSGIEKNKGIKCEKMIKKFMKRVKDYEEE
jgi:phosphoribosylanthranilate isomerase